MIALLLLLLLPAPASAWWEYGHATVARIAMLEASPRTRIQVRRLLARAPLLETPTCPARTIEAASVWADCVRALPDRFSYTAPWHYQNVHVCRPFDPEVACANGNCVSAQIGRNARLLKDRRLPPRERVAALAYLIHFVGDLHMPLHAGDRGDLGGNRFRASYGAIRSNLHAIWDGHLAERAISTPLAGARGLLAEMEPGQRPALAAGSVEDWARESWELSRLHAYGVVLPDPCAPAPERPPVVTEEQVRTLVPVVRARLLRGGLRLARLLDEALD